MSFYGTDYPEVDSAELLRQVTVTPASAVRMKVTRWTWDKRLPLGALALIGGREGIGKSLTLVILCAGLTRGTLPGAHFGTPRAVVYVANEDSWAHTIAPRLVAAGADLDLVYRVDVVSAGQPSSLVLPLDGEALQKQVERLGAVLVAVDPLVSVLDGKIDTHRDSETRRALEPLSRVAETTGAAVVGLVHHGKSQTTDALSLVLGSRAFTAVSRAVLAAVRDPEAEDGSVVLAMVKNNLGRLDLPALRYRVESAEVLTPDGPTEVGRLVWMGEEHVDLATMIRGGHETHDAEDQDDAATWLRRYLVDEGEAAAADVYKAGQRAGYSKDALKRAKRRAGVESVKTGMDSGWVWRLVIDIREPVAAEGEGSAEGGEECRAPSPTPFAPFALPSPPQAREQLAAELTTRFPTVSTA